MTCTQFVQMSMVATVAESEHEYKTLLLCWYVLSIHEITGARDYSDQLSKPTVPDQNGMPNARSGGMV